MGARSNNNLIFTIHSLKRKLLSKLYERKIKRQRLKGSEEFFL